jgi:hypothetical protein
MVLFETPSAAIRMMRARLASPCGKDREFTMALNCSCSPLDNVTGFLGRPVIMGFAPFYEITHDTKPSLFIQVINETKH